MYFSRTFKALDFDFQIRGLSRTLKVRVNPVTNNGGRKPLKFVQRTKTIFLMKTISDDNPIEDSFSYKNDDFYF